jgi:hypothetical protein
MTPTPDEKLSPEDMTGMPYDWAPGVARSGAIRRGSHPILLANGMQGSQLWIAAYAKSPLAAR